MKEDHSILSILNTGHLFHSRNSNVHNVSSVFLSFFSVHKLFSFCERILPLFTNVMCIPVAVVVVPLGKVTWSPKTKTMLGTNVWLSWIPVGIVEFGMIIVPSPNALYLLITTTKPKPNTLTVCNCQEKSNLYKKTIFKFKSDALFEPSRGKTNNVVSEHVRHKPTCTVTEKS